LNGLILLVQLVLSFSISLFLALFAGPAGDADDKCQDGEEDAAPNCDPHDDDCENCGGTFCNSVANIFEDSFTVLIAYTGSVVVDCGAIVAIVVLPVRGVVV